MKKLVILGVLFASVSAPALAAQKSCQRNLMQIWFNAPCAAMSSALKDRSDSRVTHTRSTRSVSRTATASAVDHASPAASSRSSSQTAATGGSHGASNADTGGSGNQSTGGGAVGDGGTVDTGGLGESEVVNNTPDVSPEEPAKEDPGKGNTEDGGDTAGEIPGVGTVGGDQGTVGEGAAGVDTGSSKDRDKPEHCGGGNCGIGNGNGGGNGTSNEGNGNGPGGQGNAGNKK